MSGRHFIKDPFVTRASANSITSTSRPVTITVANVKKYFGPTRALDGCSFSAVAGEIHAIVGGNGCGKSTMAKVVSGILEVDSGTVSILGETPTTPAESRAIGISTVFQEVLVADECTVVDNLFMGADALFSNVIPYDEKVERAANMMHELSGEDVDPLAAVGSLPLHLKQWITIGRAMLSNPKILILDESSAALDLDSTKRLFDKMRALRDNGVTILIVTHRIAELITISDRATVLRDGRDVGVLEKEQITEANLLSLMTGTDHSKKSHDQKPTKPTSRDIILRGRDLIVWPEGEAFNFELLKGEIVGVVGLDGQGQSEFVKTLAGIQPPVAGAVEVYKSDDTPEFIDNLKAAVDSKVVYISGDRKREGIFASLSIFENMVMPLYRLRTWGGKLGIIDWPTLSTTFKRETENLLIKFGVRGDRITSLSGGNQQKVLIGRGFAMRPNIMVLNDPARGIDVGAKAELYKHLRAFAESGKSVVYLSSELEEFMGFASRVIVFRNGSPFDAYDGETLDGAKILAAMFGQTDSSGLRGGQSAPASKLEAIQLAVEPADPNRLAIKIFEAPPAIDPKRKIRIVEFGNNGEVVSRSGQ